jgi:dTDP-4-dehydrorhamnose 3,5-epimerase
MKFTQTALTGVVVIDFDVAEDERGFFARAFRAEDFARAGIAMTPTQVNLSHNAHAFTLRGFHYQIAPHAESKLVQCLRGRIFDVALDLRRDSPSYRQWFGIELAPAMRRMLFIPEGCAHGFLTLEESSDILYVMGGAFMAEAGRGVRWNDPAFDIRWPAQPRLMAPRDGSYPDFQP